MDEESVEVIDLDVVADTTVLDVRIEVVVWSVVVVLLFVIIVVIALELLIIFAELATLVEEVRVVEGLVVYTAHHHTVNNPKM